MKALIMVRETGGSVYTQVVIATLMPFDIFVEMRFRYYFNDLFTYGRNKLYRHMGF